MYVIGITGGSGAGKGLICEILAEHGIASIDTDKVSRQVCGPGSPCLSELAEAFGEGILTEKGELDRGGLAALVFLEPEEEKRQRLLGIMNRITHKHILKACESWLEERRRNGEAAAAVDAPLLFESGFDTRCDCIWGVTAPRETRIRRIMRRDGISEALAAGRIDSQKSDDFFYKNCDAVIVNGTTRANAEKQVTRLLSEYLKSNENKRSRG